MISNRTNFAQESIAPRITNPHSLKMLLQYAVEKYSENARSAPDLKRQLAEIEQRQLSGNDPQLLQFEAGFRKGKRPKK